MYVELNLRLFTTNGFLLLRCKAAMCHVEQIGGQANNAVPPRSCHSTAKPKPCIHQASSNLETTTTATTLAASGIRWSRGNILDSANLHAGTGESTESRLSARAWGLSAITWKIISNKVKAKFLLHNILTSSSTDLDVQSVDAQFLASSSNVLSSQHSSVRGRLVTVCLDLHASGDTSDGFAATGITQKVSL